MFKRFIYEGAIDYPDHENVIKTITDEDVYKLIKKHSRFIDRLSQAKMVEMSIRGQLIIARVYEDIVDPDDPVWMFYGKNGFFDKLNKCCNQ